MATTTEPKLLTDEQLEHAEQDLASVLAGPNPGSVKLWAKHYGQRLIHDLRYVWNEHRQSVKLLQVAAAMMSWRPIETAPKDGTRVLVWATGQLPQIAWWSDLVNEHVTDRRIGEWTHWQPLPASPNTGA